MTHGRGRERRRGLVGNPRIQRRASADLLIRRSMAARRVEAVRRAREPEVVTPGQRDMDAPPIVR